MKPQQLNQKKVNYTVLAFAMPFFGIVGVMLISGYTPFGDYSMLYSDMYHQYFPFFVAFRKALLSGDSLLYSQSMGLGMDYLGLISYYLASPLNLLSVLIPESILLQYFSFLVPIKLGFAGLFFALFLKKTFHKNDFSISLFGAFYALCAWALGYQWNVMWLDSFAVLPLVVLGMTALLKKRKFLLYTSTLFLAVAANYYIGLFICIFILLVFFCYEFCRWKSFKRFFIDLSLMAVFSILAIGMTAFLELPAFAALQTTQSSVNRFPEGFRLNIASEDTWKGLLEAMVQVAGNMNGGVVPTFKEGLPNLYCGVLTNILASIFLTCSGIKLRDKLCSVFLLVFFNLSFVIRQLDYIWHGFHFTNMIPYRFSFLYSFVMLYMAYRAYLMRSRFKLWQLVFGALTSIALILCYKEPSQVVLWAYNVGFLVLYLAALSYGIFKKPIPQVSTEEDRQYQIRDENTRSLISSILIFGFMAIELVMTLINFGLNFTGTYIVNYPSGTTDTETVISYMENQEETTLFYRAEMTHSQTLNDGALNGYNGITAFTSSANVNTTKFMQALGYGAKNTYNRYCFEESSPVSNLFLGLKYMIERDGNVEENAYFDDVYQSGSVHLLKNNAYLPLGFLAEETLVDVDFASGSNPFVFQNKLFAAATGVQDNVWDLLSFDTLYVFGTDVTIRGQSGNGHTSYSGPEKGTGTLTYRYLVDKQGHMCINLDLSERNNFTVFKNGTKLYSETHSLPQMLSVSDVIPGDIIEIQFVCEESEEGTIDVSAAILDNEVFRAGYDILNAATLQLTIMENTLVEGTVSCNRDGYLYTSIPQNGNWSVFVDGEPVQISLTGNVMIGVFLTEGEHTVCFQYHNEAFQLGWKISVICFGVLCAITLLACRKNRYKGKYLH